jgi:hypothetical protein
MNFQNCHHFLTLFSSVAAVNSFVAGPTIVRRVLSQAPPQVNLNLGNVSFPAISIPNLPHGIGEQSIYNLIGEIFKQTINQYLNHAATVAVQELVKSLLFKFERIELNHAWKQV